MSQKQADKSNHTLRKSLANAAGLMCIAFILVAVTLYIANVSSAELAIVAKVNGTPVGCIASYSDMADASARLTDSINVAADGRYTPAITVDYDYTYVNDPVFLTEEECFDILWSQIESDFCIAYMLYVDDCQAAAYGDRVGLDTLITSIEAELLNAAPDEFSNVEISNRLRIEEQLCLKSSVKTIEEINVLLNPLAAQEAQTSENNTTVTARIASLDAAVPSADEEETENDLTLDYTFLNTITLTETIPFETTHIDDPDSYIGTEKVMSEGSDGTKIVTYELIYDTEGRFIGRNAVSETVITEADARIILVGSAEIPAAEPTGTIIWPCSRPKGVSSYYGWRDLYGRPDFHLGIDIPDVRGSVIWAADGGTVLFAGYTPSYGYNVHIEHSNGFSTLYAHLDTIIVSEGDKLYQGQQVGTMGATGVAYGNHLHFEVRINNKTVDPINYLPEE